MKAIPSLAVFALIGGIGFPTVSSLPAAPTPKATGAGSPSVAESPPDGLSGSDWSSIHGAHDAVHYKAAGATYPITIDPITQ